MNLTELAHYEVEQGIGVITLDNPPLNALNSPMRQAIIEAVRNGNADPAVQALVLIGAGGNFIAGADIRQLGAAGAVASRTSAAALEASEKPVIAAIEGYALGGGLEHALACHWRIANTTAQLGLPEVHLGLIPGGGGTQRLTRLVGPQIAADIILSCRHVGTEEAQRLGLLDEVTNDTDLRRASLAFARRIAAQRPLRRLSERCSSIASAAVNAQVLADLRQSLARKGRHLTAPMHALTCIEAAVNQPFDEGIKLEEKLFKELEASDQSRALRYAFFAERQAAKIPGVPQGYKAEPVRSVAVIGAGTMGSGIAIAYADARVTVKVLESSAEALDRGMQRIRDTYATRVKRSSLSQTEMDQRLARIQAVQHYADIADCDAVVEAVFERIDIKQEVFRQLDAVMKPGALLLTNSSAIDIDVMAQATHRPSDVAGAHFFAPANVMKLCEVVRGPQTSPETLARTMKMGRDIGKICAVAGSCDGFAANRSRTPMMTELMLMLEEGARPAQVDQVMVEFGYPLGPFAVNDLSGLDVSYEGRKRRAAANPNYRKLHVPDRLVEMGRKGQKTGAGWYRYLEGDRTPRPDEAVDTLISQVALELGVPQRKFDGQEILERLLFASVNEACKILEEGKAFLASDIDVMWLHGFGFPRHRGGLMFWADTIGAAQIHRQVCDWHQAYGPRWAPSALLAQVAAAGKTLREVTA